MVRVNLVDTSVWVPLLLSEHQFSAVARAWMAEVARPGEAAFCRATQQSVLRLLTTSALFTPYERPMTNAQAWAAYHELVADERVSFVEEPAGVEAEWERLASRRSASPKLWMDAYLAAFAIVGGYQFVTTDRGFGQHEGLDLVVLGER